MEKKVFKYYGSESYMAKEYNEKFGMDKIISALNSMPECDRREYLANIIMTLAVNIDADFAQLTGVLERIKYKVMKLMDEKNA